MNVLNLLQLILIQTAERTSRISIFRLLGLDLENLGGSSQILAPNSSGMVKCHKKLRQEQVTVCGFIVWEDEHNLNIFLAKIFVFLHLEVGAPCYAPGGEIAPC